MLGHYTRRFVFLTACYADVMLYNYLPVFILQVRVN